MHEMSHGRSESLIRGYTGRMAITLALGSLGVSMGRQLLPVLLPTIISELTISASKAGIALTAMWATFAVSQYPAGRYSDQWSRTTILVGGAGILILSFGLLTTVISYPVLVVSVAGVGLGSGLFVISIRAMLSDLFIERRGQAFGINTSANMLGGVAASGISVLVISIAAWQLAFLPVIGLLAAVIVFLHVWSHEEYVISRVELGLGDTVKRVFGTRRLVWLVVAYSLYMITWQGVFGFLPTVLQASKDFSPTLAAIGFATLFVMGIVVMPTAGKLSDGTQRLPISAGGLLLSAVGLILIIVAPVTPLIILGIVCFAVGITSFPPVMQAFLMDTFPDGSMGGDFGVFRTVYFGLGSLGPAYVGFVAEYLDYLIAFAGLVGCLVLSSGIILGIHFTDRRA